MDTKEMKMIKMEQDLAENAKQTGLRFDKITTPKNRTGAVLTFIDDDGKAEVLSLWKPITDAKGINISINQAVNMIGAGTYLTLEQLHTLEDAGYDVLSHSLTHPLMSTLTEAQLDVEFGDSQEYFRQHGFKNTNILVYPTGLAEVTQLVKDTARKYYEYCIDAGGGIATMPVDPMCVKRLADAGTIESLKAALDTAVASGDWLIVMTHCWGAFDAAKISALIDYAVSLNVPILKLSDALELKGNIVGAGEYTGLQNFYMSRDGRIKSSNYITSKYGTSTSFDNAITAYKRNTITVELITTANATNAPVAGVEGALVTYNFLENGYSYQLYIPRDVTSNIKRRMNNGAAWLAWSDDGALKSKYGNANSFTNSLTAYPVDKVTYEIISAANAASAPAAGVAGTLITYRFTDSTYSYQEYKVANAKTRYTRAWGGPWGAWELIV